MPNGGKAGMNGGNMPLGGPIGGAKGGALDIKGKGGMHHMMMHDDKESMTAVEFMQKSLEVLQEKMAGVEHMIDEVKTTIDSQESKVKNEIKDIT